MENQNLEHARQNLASKLVEREVVCCVSSLMSGILKLSQSVSYKDMQEALDTDYDELSELFFRYDYEEAARQFIMDDADRDELESIVDESGYWSDVIDVANVPTVYESKPDEDGNTLWGLEGKEAEYGDENDALEAAADSVLPAIREGVWTLVDKTSGAAQQVCEDFSLDPDTVEVYEHWVVSGWLASKLAEKGEITGDVCGLTVWGRCCTGQSISMDSVIREIAHELWPDEWAGKVVV